MGMNGIDTVVSFFNELLVFMLVFILLFAIIGFLSRSFAVGAFSGFMLFAYLALESSTTLTTEFLYLIVFGILLYLGFGLSNYVLGGGGGTTP